MNSNIAQFPVDPAAEEAALAPTVSAGEPEVASEVMAHPVMGSAERSRVRRQRALGTDGTHGKAVPANPGAELHLLAWAFVEGREVLRRCEEFGLRAEEFTVATHAAVFRAMRSAYLGGLEVSLPVVAQVLKDSGQLEAAGGFVGVAKVSDASLLSREMNASSVLFFMEKVREAHVKRERIRLARAYEEAVYAGDAQGLMDAEAELREVASASTRALPSLMDWGTLIGATQRAMPPELVAGVIHQGGKVMLGGGSKSFKTWVLTDLALSVATGTPWWGMRTTAARVLMVNFELKVESFEARVRSIAAAKKIVGAVPNFVSWHLRGYARDLKELTPHFMARLAGSKFDMIILDPIYKCLGDRDENANGEVAALLNEVEALAVRSEAAVVFGHHFSKGNHSEKDARDRVSGAGAWTRDPDTVITLTPHEEEEHFAAEFVLRDFKPRPAMVVRWRHPVMEWEPGKDPSALKKAGAPRKSSADDVVGLIAEGERLTDGEWFARARDRKDMSESSYKRRKNEALESGKVVREMGTYRLK